MMEKRKKIACAFAVFMAFMLLCTLISRAVYASGLCQVTTKKPERRNIVHRVQTEGIVQPGMEYALNIPGGLRCKTVYVHTGDRVTEETLLFEVDTEDLKEQIQEQQLTIQKLQMTIEDQEHNRDLNEEKRQIEALRAEEDYNRIREAEGDTVGNAEKALEKAKEALEAAEAAYQEHLANPVEDPGMAPVPENPEAPENKEWQAKKEAWEAEQKAWEEQSAFLENEKENARQAAEAAKQVLEAAEKNQSAALLEAERRVGDMEFPSQADSSAEINKLELSALSGKLEKYQKLLKSEGKIYAEEEGIVTKIAVSPGERIGDGAAMVYADLNSPLQFGFSLTKEQKKYVNMGDRAKLTIEGKTVDVTIDYIQQNEGNPEVYNATVFLTEGTGNIGQSGSFEREQQSEMYSCVIPIDALHEDENRRNFVYILSERSGILGTELSAMQVYVKVLDKNDSYAAIEEGSIDSDTELIVSATKELKDRVVVRYRE